MRRVQDLRKSAGLDVADRIELYLAATAGLKSAVEAHQDYITGETLTVALKFEAPPTGAPSSEDEFEGEKATFGFSVKA